ncbi:MAG TPA: chemotaxis protein CheA, partial [Gammaproteobacteria bacterium]|nr:chemotaxis protein CheA [Gammaproteobacteria bacterium]
MSLDTDDEILQDFLVEAGEILERLNEELVELEQRPGDTELLNSVFRGFHTIKGGASFLGLEGLVQVCHRAEDVFNVLRNGDRQADTVLMDTILQVLDVVNGMFAEVQSGEMPTPADPGLLQTLEGLAVPAAEEPEAATTEDGEEAQPVDEAEAAFEAMLDEAAAASPEVNASDDEITEEEFEALLDELHGTGKAPTPPAGGKAGESADDEITEEEFEALLDELHGSGKAPTPPKQSQPAAAAQPATPKPGHAGAAAGKAAAAAQPARAEATVRVDTRRLDDIMNMVGELVLARNRLATLKETLANEDMAKA